MYLPNLSIFNHQQNGSSCLHWATRKQLTNIIPILINRGIDKDCYDEDGWTCL